jgi:hypothetical protein
MLLEVIVRASDSTPPDPQTWMDEEKQAFRDRREAAFAELYVGNDAGSGDRNA